MKVLLFDDFKQYKLKYSMNKLILVFIVVFLLNLSSAFAIERRGPQFLTESSYLVFPLPYSLPGIGEGVMVTALGGNIYDTNIDAYAIAITGDAEGIVAAVEDIHILPKFLILDIMHQNISKAVVNNYDTRGMNTDKDDYSLIEVDKVVNNYAKLTLTLFDRMLEFFAVYRDQKARIINIKDPDGNLLANLSEPYISKSASKHLGFLIDYTDDRINPKKGLKFSSTYKSSDRKSDSDPEYYTIDNSLSFYIPMTDSLNLACNVFLSDAHVTKTGETDTSVLKQELGLNCDPSDTECLNVEEGLVNMLLNTNKNGNATSLGGDRRLRAYPGDRFGGAHSLYYSTELRWNMSEKVRPFNFWIWKDVATGLQIATFFERGSVAESFDDLGKQNRSTYGGGFRLVSASGFVYRADFAKGDEGSEMTIMFSYPW